MKITDDKLSLATYLTCVTVASVIWSLSRWGLGTSPDSIVYIAGARSLADGTGFSLISSGGNPVPIAQYPPVFSGALAILSAIGVDPLDGAAILNAALLAVNTCLSAALVYRATGSAVAGSIASMLTLTAPAILTTHTMVWSEPLFLTLLLLTALALTRYQQMKSYASLLWIVLPAGLAPLTRYAGLSVVIVAASTIGRQNLKHAAVFTMATSAGIVAWLVRSYPFASNTGYKSLGFHPPSADQLNLALQTITEWFGGPLLLLVIAGLLVAGLARRAPYVDSRGGAGFLRDFALFYAVLIPFMISFVTSEIPFDRRNLSPLYLSLSLWAIIKITSIATGKFRLLWPSIAVLIVVLNSWTSIEWVKILSTQGIGFSSAAWRSSPTINYLKTHRIPQLHTNAPDPVFLLAATPATMLPRHTDPGTRNENPAYPKQIAEIKKNGGAVVYFRAVQWRWYLPDEERLKTELSLHRIAELGDGAVYAIDPASIVQTYKEE